MSVYAARLRLGAALVALMAVVSGCGGDPPAPPPFTPSTSASSPTPTGPVQPVLPQAAKAPTAAGAEAFAKFYWEMGNYAQATGDTGGLRALGAQTCDACTNGSQGVERIYADGGTVRGGLYTPRVIESRNTSTAVKAYTVTLRLAISAQVIDYPGDKKDVHAGSGVGRIRMTLNFLSGSWVVAFMEKP
jgi:hypothetical protein